MPHDAKGNELKVGDKVNIPAIIIGLHQTEDYCNVDVKFVYKMPPNDSVSTLSALNTKQVEKA